MIDSNDDLASSDKYQPEDFLDVDHDCNDEYQPDCDICSGCKDHAGFCSICELSTCCGASETSVDFYEN